MKGKIVIAGIAHGVYVDTGPRDNIISAGRFKEACIVHKYAVVKPPRRSLSEKAIAAQIIDTYGMVVFTIYGSGHISAFDYPEPISIYLTEFGKTITKAEMDRAIAARKLQTRLGHASHQAVMTMSSRESIISNVRQRDVAFARDALGPDLIILEANQPRKKVRLEIVGVEQTERTEVNQIAHTDVFETIGKAWVLAVHEPMHLMCANNLHSVRTLLMLKL